MKLDVSKLDFSKYSDVALTLGKAAVDKLKASGKPLVITGNGFTLTVPADALDDFTTSSGFSLAVSVAASKAGSENTLNAVSPIVSIKHGDKFKHQLLLTLNYDPTKVKDARKVGAYVQSEKATCNPQDCCNRLSADRSRSVSTVQVHMWLPRIT